MPIDVVAAQPRVEPMSERRRACLLIEFVGGPASGKSTIERALRDALLMHGHQPLSRVGFLAWAALGPHRSPLTPLLLLTRIAAGGPGTWTFFLKMIAWCIKTAPSGCRSATLPFVLTAKRAWLARSIRTGKNAHIIYPEFFINSVAKLIALDKLCLQDNVTWLSSFYDDVDVLFVYVDTSADECFRRLEMRAEITSHVQNMAQPLAAEYLQRLKNISETCLDCAVSGSGAKVVRVDGSGPVEPTVRALVAQVVERATRTEVVAPVAGCQHSACRGGHAANS